MIKLSETQRVILTTAAQRDGLSILPLPETVKLKGGALKQVMHSLIKRGLIRVVQTDPDRIVITSEGVAAIGSDSEDETTMARDPNAESTAKAGAATKPVPRAGTKQALLIDMLKRPEGATVEQIAEATGWQRHTIRGAISGALKKKLGLTIETSRAREVGPNKTGATGSTTTYRIVS